MNILITGASRGIGYELSKLFAADGHHVIATARSADKLHLLSKECLSADPESMMETIAFDLTRIADMESVLAGFVSGHFAELDVLINNAGYLVRNDFHQISNEEALNSCAVNYLAPARLTAVLLPLLKKSARPHVINVGSMAGFQGSKKFPGLSHYSAAKGALAVLTESLAEEYRDTRIRFNCLALGAVRTEMLALAFPDLRAPLSADEMAAFIKEFALGHYDFYNGKIIPVAPGNP